MERTKRILALALMVMTMLFSLVACTTTTTSTGQPPPAGPAASSPSASSKPSEKITLKLGSNTATSNPENQYAYKLAELVATATDGNVTIEVYDSAQLGDHLERQEGLRMGTIDMTLTSIGYLGGYDQVFSIFEMPYLFADNNHQNKVFTNPEVIKMISDRAIKYGFVLVDCLEMGARHITNSARPIVKPQDLTGLKLRVPDTKSSIEGLTAMGATPAPLAFSELYMALQQKQMDGQENPLSTMYSSKFYEVQSYLSLTGHQRFEQILLFSELSWKKIPEEYQKVIMDCAVDANDYLKGVIEKEESELLVELQKIGMKINDADIPSFMEQVKPLKAEYITRYGDDAKAFFDKIESLQ